MLVAPSHPGNVGAAARAMLTMGLARLVLVRPRRFPDPEAVALASGATVVLDGAEVVATLDAALAGCVAAVGLSARPREFAGRVLAVREAAAEAIAHAAHGDVALVFGTEMSGTLQRRARALRHRRDDSRERRLCVAQSRGRGAGRRVRAAARRDRRRSLARAAFQPATVDEIEALYAHGTATLAAMRFLDPRMPKRLLPRLRRLFSRAALEKEEVNILRGILARIDQLLERR